MEIEEIKSRKEVLIMNIQNFIDEFEKETGVVVVEIDYMTFNTIGSKSSIKINDIKLWI